MLQNMKVNLLYYICGMGFPNSLNIEYNSFSGRGQIGESILRPVPSIWGWFLLLAMSVEITVGS